MAEHPVLPDMTPAEAVHTLLRVAFDLAMIAGGGLLATTLAAFLMDRPSLGVLAAIGACVAGLGAMRIHTGRFQLEKGHV